MKYRPSSETEPFGTQIQDNTREMLNTGRILRYPGDTNALTGNPVAHLLDLPQIGGEESSLFTKSAEIITARTARHLDPGLISSVATLLNQAELIILCSSAGIRNLRLGVTKQDEELGFTYIGLARTLLNQDRTVWEIAGTLFHELIHVAEAHDQGVDESRYLELYLQYSNQIQQDDFMKTGLAEEGEIVVRVFQGALFGSSIFIESEADLEESTQIWQERYPDMLELVGDDQYTLLHEPESDTNEGKTKMTPREHTIVRPLPGLDSKSITILCGPDIRVPYPPEYYRVLLWLREQARLAEEDPRREWLGYRAEFDKLLSGQHPDPHPEEIILGKKTDSFDPTSLEYPREEIIICDNDAFNKLRRNKEGINGYPAGSQQAYAYLCGKYMEDCLKNGTTDDQPPVQRTPIE